MSRLLSTGANLGSCSTVGARQQSLAAPARRNDQRRPVSVAAADGKSDAPATAPILNKPGLAPPPLIGRPNSAPPPPQPLSRPNLGASPAMKPPAMPATIAKPGAPLPPPPLARPASTPPPVSAPSGGNGKPAAPATLPAAPPASSSSPPAGPAPPPLSRPSMAPPSSSNPFANLPPLPSSKPPAPTPSAAAPLPATPLARPAAMPLSMPVTPPPLPQATPAVTPLSRPAQPLQRPDMQQRNAAGRPQEHSVNRPADSQLHRPEAPSLRVLEPLIDTDKPAARRWSPAQKSVNDDGTAEFGASKAVKKSGPRRKEKVTAEMRRKARQLRVTARDEKAANDRKEREEIFEVGEEGMSLEELADLIQIDPSEIVRTLFMKGIMLSLNQVLDRDTCKVVADEFDVVVVDRDDAALAAAATKARRTDFLTDDDIDDLAPRPPVVTVMGHVDHGKTSLLDFIRKKRVAAGEAGGITQSIGAYNTTVEVDGESKTICFLDTPGHEAFSAMRARGTQVTDIAIIIVAADDGVRPQTREAVSHAQAAEVPIIVAINKIDKPGADVERAKQQMLELNLVPEEWGGDTPMVPVSAKKGDGIQDLLQMILWAAEEKQLMANPKKPAQGTVIEAHIDKKVGPVATLLVQAGTLRPGDIVSAGACYGKVRTLVDDLGKPITGAGPSIAVQISGLDATPQAGERFAVYATESDARESAGGFMDRQRMQRLNDMTGGGSKVTLSSLATMDDDDGSETLQKLNLIVKADTVGMVEAIKAGLGSLPQLSITLRFLLSGAGDISISDVDLASASGALLLGFNLNPSEAVNAYAKNLGVNIMTYKVIYALIDDVKAAMEGKLKAVEERIVQGKAEVKAIFGSGKKRVAGCAVLTGKLQKGAMATVMRGKKVLAEGKISSLRRIKDAVEEVSEGTECGVFVDGFLEWSEGDTIECYTLVTKNRRLEEARATVVVDIATLA